jgi:hypothetical protein
MKKLILFLAVLTLLLGCSAEENERNGQGLDIHEKFWGTWVTSTDTIKVEEDRVTINDTIVITQATWGARDDDSNYVGFFLDDGEQLGFWAFSPQIIDILYTPIHQDGLAYYKID